MNISFPVPLLLFVARGLKQRLAGKSEQIFMAALG
jgi:hypothetical protein